MKHIKTAMERFKAYCESKGIPEKSSLAHIHKMSQFEEHERKELRAALETLQTENFELKLKAEIYEASIKLFEGIKKENAEQKNQINHLQYTVDELMFEYCQDEMTPEQIANYAAHQIKVIICNP